MFQRAYVNDGFSNEDWFGFDKDVLSPCDCTVEKIHINSITNEPGMIQRQRRGCSEKRHRCSQVGSNGYSRNPHIHIGAWNADGTPLQIRFDQNTRALSDREQGGLN